MKQTIAISAFAEMLARQSGYTIDFCERFVLEMFKTVADSLKESNNVSIKGLGKFIITDDGNIDFIPDDTFASDVNAPFDCFEPELLDDDITDAQLSADGDEDIIEITDGDNDNTITETSDEVLPDEESVNDDEILPETVVEITEETETAPDESAEIEIEAEEEPKANSVETEAIEESKGIENASEDIDAIFDEVAHSEDSIIEEKTEETPDLSLPKSEEVAQHRRLRPAVAFVGGIILGAIAGATATYFLLLPKENSTSSEATVYVQESTDVLTDSVTNKPENDIIKESEASITENVAVPAEVYDTVTSTLAQLSRKHYGTYEFWVYIYEENKDVISDPDRIEPNTRVRIPSAEKYGIDTNDKASINNALKKSQEISLQRKK